MCELRQDLFREVGEAAGAARAHFYFIQPGDLMATPTLQATETISEANFRGSDDPIEGIEHLVGVTGGMMLPLTPIPRVRSDGSPESPSSYLAAIDPERGDLTEGREAARSQSPLGPACSCARGRTSPFRHDIVRALIGTDRQAEALVMHSAEGPR